jgi:hypothetical protein
MAISSLWIPIFYHLGSSGWVWSPGSWVGGVEGELRVGRKSWVLWECGGVGARSGDPSPSLFLSSIQFQLFFSLRFLLWFYSWVFLMKKIVISKIWRFSLKFNKSSGMCTRKNTILHKTIQISMVKMTKIVEKIHWFCLKGWEGGGAKCGGEMSSITCSSYLLVYFGDYRYTRWCSSSGDVVTNAEKPVTHFCSLALPWQARILRLGYCV